MTLDDSRALFGCHLGPFFRGPALPVELAQDFNIWVAESHPFWQGEWRGEFSQRFSQEYGGLSGLAFDTYRCLAFLAAITGNVGVAGGGCNFMHNTWPGDLRLPALTQPCPPRREALPVGPDYFAESILSQRPYAIKALVTAGSPILGSANTEKVQRAFRQLDFYVYTGLFMEEAAHYADIILPVCSGFEMETGLRVHGDR